METTEHSGWHDFATDPPDDGHYLVIWDTVPHRDFPDLCSDYDVLLWSCGRWYAPVSELQPVLYWRELPAKPEHIAAPQGEDHARVQRL